MIPREWMEAICLMGTTERSVPVYRLLMADELIVQTITTLKSHETAMIRRKRRGGTLADQSISRTRFRRRDDAIVWKVTIV